MKYYYDHAPVRSQPAPNELLHVQPHAQDFFAFTSTSLCHQQHECHNIKFWHALASRALGYEYVLGVPAAQYLE